MRTFALVRLLPALLAALQATTALAGNYHNTQPDEVEFVATAWYAGWHAQDFPLANVSWDKYTEMTYAFA
jgi:chitinase